MSTSMATHPARLDERRRALAADPRHLNYARSIARGYARKFPRLAQDVYSSAYLGLCVAASSYDFARGFNFMTFATLRVHGEVLDMLRKQGLRGYRRTNGERRGGAPGVHSLALNAFGHHDDGTNHARRKDTLAELLSSGDDPIGTAVEAKDELRSLASKAGDGRTSQALRLLYGHACCCTVRTAAVAMALSPSHVAAMHVAGIRRLRVRFGVEPDDPPPYELADPATVPTYDVPPPTTPMAYKTQRARAKLARARRQARIEAMAAGMDLGADAGPYPSLGCCPACGTEYAGANHRRCYACHPAPPGRRKQA